jgi:hypothetical protein
MTVNWFQVDLNVLLWAIYFANCVSPETHCVKLIFDVLSVHEGLIHG